MGSFEGTTWRQTLSWERQLPEAEQQQVVQMQYALGQLLPLPTFSREGKDRILWGLKTDNNVKTLSAKAQAIKDQEAMVDNLVCTIQRKLAPPKGEMMTWLALLGRLNTKDLLYKNKRHNTNGSQHMHFM